MKKSHPDPDEIPGGRTPFDVRKYHRYLDGLDMTDEQKDDFAYALCGFLRTLIDRIHNASADEREAMFEKARLSKAETPEQA